LLKLLRSRNADLIEDPSGIWTRILWQDGQVGPPIHALVLHEALITKLTPLFLSHFRPDRYIKLEVKGSHDCSLGEGAYGVVFKCLDKQTNKEVAVKKIRMEIEEEGIPTTALREMTLLRSLDHPNVVCLENVVMELGRLHLVFELVETDLKKFLDSTDELLRPEVVQVSGGRDPFVILLSH